jgi:uncharacterized membrane protein
MMIALRLIHILVGVFWAGAAFFVATILLPSIRAAGPAGGPVMRQIVGVRKFPVIATYAGLLTVVSGGFMYWHNISISHGTWAKSVPGMTYGIGALAALVTMGIGGMIMAPTARKVGELGAAMAAAAGPPNPTQAGEMQALQARLQFGTRIGAVFLCITVITMAVARYL